MTKNFCDKCSKEVQENRNIRISICGNTSTEKLLYENLYLCEKCYIKDNKILQKVFSNRTKEKVV